MLRGLYIATTGMISQTRRLDVVSNNLANIETKGYKSDNLLTRSFEDMMIENSYKDPNIVGTDRLAVGTGIHIDEINTSFAQGSFEETTLSCDLALLGDGFFVVETPNGIRYTRAGNFTIDANGYLITNEGYRLLSDNGYVYVGSNDFSVSPDGTVTAVDGSTCSLRLVSFEDNGALRKEGSNLFYNFGGLPELEADCQVKQGFLENSNVDLSTQMVELINISRNYETNQRMIRMMDGVLSKTVNEVGKV